MIRPNKILPIIAFVTVIHSCKKEEDTQSKSEITDIKQYVQKIDELPDSESAYIIQVDENKTVIDTLGLKRKKFDEDGNLLFESGFQRDGKIETLDYYTDYNGMVYSLVKQNNQTMLEYKTNVENGIIKSAVYNVYDDGDVGHSFEMNYKYTFKDGKIVELVIEDKEGFNTIEFYNKYEKPVLNFSTSENDTVERTRFIYDKDQILTTKKFKNFLKNEETIYEYKGKNNLVKETFFQDGKERGFTIYEKDANGNYLSQSMRVVDENE